MSVTDRILMALTTVIRMNNKVEEMAGLMKEQQHRIDDLNSRLIRLETMFEIALNRSSVQRNLERITYFYAATWASLVFVYSCLNFIYLNCNIPQFN